MDKVLSVLKNSKILGIVGAILLIIGNFFSFATVKMFWVEESVSFIEGDGVFCFNFRNTSSINYFYRFHS